MSVFDGMAIALDRKFHRPISMYDKRFLQRVQFDCIEGSLRSLLRFLGVFLLPCWSLPLINVEGIWGCFF